MEKFIRVTGEGEVAIPPDTISVSLGITGLNKDYAKSLMEVDKKVCDIKNAVKEVGIKDKDITTSSFSVSQRSDSTYNDRTKKYDRAFLGYETRHLLNISFDYDTRLLGEVISQISGVSAQPQLRISFLAKNQDAVKAELLKKAVLNAREDAEALAAAAGVTLGEVLNINHSFSEVHINYPAEARMEGEVMSKASIGSSLSEINVEDIKIRATVTIDYKI